MTEDSRTRTGWMRAYEDAWNAHDVAAALALMTDDVVWIDTTLGVHEQGAAAVRAFLDTMETTLSTDYRLKLGRGVSDDSTYAFEWTLSGTNDRADPAHGLPATGRPFQIQGVSIGRLREGRIVENKDYWNLAGYLVQVGLMPAPEAAGQT